MAIFNTIGSVIRGTAFNVGSGLFSTGTARINRNPVGGGITATPILGGIKRVTEKRNRPRPIIPPTRHSFSYENFE